MPKIVNHEQYRNELLTKSFDYFAEHGYGSVTMRQLSTGIGVSTGTLYHYFESKQQLFLQLIGHLSEQDILVGAGLPAENAPLDDKLAALFKIMQEQQDYYLKQTLIWLDFYRQSGQASDENPFLSSLNERYRTWFKEYLGVDEPVADLVMAVLSGVVVTATYGPSTSLASLGDLLAKMIRAYLVREDNHAKSGK